MVRHLVVCALALTACKTTNSETLASQADQSASTGMGTAYLCKGTGSEVGIGNEVEIVVNESFAKFSVRGDDSPTLGKFDTKYKPRKNPRAIRYTDFDWGDDCAFEIVMDRSVLEGADRPKARLSCRGDSYYETTFKCQNQGQQPLPTPNKPKPQPEPEFVATYRCQGNTVVNGPSTLRVGAKTVELETQEFPGDPYIGKLDAKYKPKSGNQMRYYLDTGWDCASSVIVPKAALSRAQTIRPRVDCRGDGFMSETLSCKIDGQGGAGDAPAPGDERSPREIFEDLADTMEIGNGGIFVQSYDVTKYDRAAALKDMQDERPNGSGPNGCQFEDVVGFADVMSRKFPGAGEAEQQLGTLNAQGQLVDVLLREYVSGESEACSNFDYRFYAKDGSLLEIDFDFND